MKKELYTGRFRLRPLCEKDVRWVAALYTDPLVMRYIRPHRGSSEEALRDAEALIWVDHQNPHFGYWAIEETGEMHGLVALKKLSGADDIEVGFRLKKTSWGRGIATEAAARLIAYGFEEVGLGRIVAVTHPNNLASRRVIEKLGFNFEKIVVSVGVEWLNFALSRQPQAVSGASAR